MFFSSLAEAGEPCLDPGSDPAGDAATFGLPTVVVVGGEGLRQAVGPKGCCILLLLPLLPGSTLSNTEPGLPPSSGWLPPPPPPVADSGDVVVTMVVFVTGNV